MQRFWSLEFTGIETKTSDSTSDDKIIGSFEKKIVKLEYRYEVSLPGKEKITLDTNEDLVTKRLMQLTTRLGRNEEFLKSYDKAISEYFSSNVAERVQDKTERLTTLCYYMPHIAVILEDRETTKVRVVFDASSSSTKGRSLNDN